MYSSTSERHLYADSTHTTSERGVEKIPLWYRMKFAMPNVRSWFTKSYWVLDTPAASFATHEHWSNADVDVVPEQQRVWRAAIGNIIIAAAITMNGAIGSRHHIPFSIASRASMGFYFSYFAVVSRLVLGLLYFGINSYIGSSCMLIMLEAIWPSLKTFPNALPASAAVTSNRMIAYFVFWILQFPLVMIPPRKMRWLFFIKSLFAVIASFALLGWAVHKAGGAGPIFHKGSTLKGSAKAWAWVASINIAISGKTTLALNMPDLARYARKSSDVYWQMLFVPLIYFVFSFIGIVVASCGEVIYGKLYWDPTSIIALWTNRAAAFFCAFAFGLATLGTNISTNSIATSNDFAFLLPKYLNIKRGAFLTCILGGYATVPWQIQKSATSLTTFLSGYIIVLAPIVAIMIADYWIVRKTRLHVPMLYQNEGIYRYTWGINWRALVTLVIVIPINLPGLIHAINAKVLIGNYAYFYKASWLTSFSISFCVYIILSKIFPPTSTFVSYTIETMEEEAAYDMSENSMADDKKPAEY
ncbi:nucleobase:cation symporter-1, NCS1 family, partial [Tremellales sp. Uapishka_1]